MATNSPQHTCLWTREGGAKTPCFRGQLKYRTPPTDPSFFPLGLSNSIPNQNPVRDTNTHTLYKQTHFEKCSDFLADQSLCEQSPICHLSVQLEPKQTNTKSYDLSKSSYSFKKLCNARTNKQLLFSKQSTGWAYSMNVRIADEKGTLRGRWISP